MKTDGMANECSISDYLWQTPLQPGEERIYIKLLEKGGQEARRVLIERNMRIVFFVACNFLKSGVGLDDLISIGTIGLVKAVDSFKASKQAKISTYATKCIENEILMYLRRDRKNRAVSLERVFELPNERGKLSLINTLSTDADIVWKEVERHVARREVLKIVRTLSPIDAEVMLRRFGLDGKLAQTQKEVACNMGITQSYVSRIEKKALQRIREKIGR